MATQLISANRLVTEVLIDLVNQQLAEARSDFGATFAVTERADMTALLQALQIALEQGDHQDIQLIQQGLQSASAKFRDQTTQRLHQEEILWQERWRWDYN